MSDDRDKTFIAAEALERFDAIVQFEKEQRAYRPPDERVLQRHREERQRQYDFWSAR